MLVLIDNNRVRVSLDMAGDELLYKRGYRAHVTTAPLRESLSAAVVASAVSDARVVDAPATLIDPFCGSGTLLLEAALAAFERHTHQHLCMRSFAFEQWRTHDATAYATLRRSLDVVDQIDFTKCAAWNFVGGDRDKRAIEAAQNNAIALGASEEQAKRMFAVRDANKTLDNALAALSSAATPLIVTNGPFGRRLDASQQPIERFLSRTQSQRRADAARVYLLTQKTMPRQFRFDKTLLDLQNRGLRVRLMRWAKRVR